MLILVPTISAKSRHNPVLDGGNSIGRDISGPPLKVSTWWPDVSPRGPAGQSLRRSTLARHPVDLPPIGSATQVWYIVDWAKPKLTAVNKLISSTACHTACISFILVTLVFYQCLSTNMGMNYFGLVVKDIVREAQIIGS